MPDDPKPPLPEDDLNAGTAASQPQPETQPIRVAPTTEVVQNTIRAFLVPVGCWRIDDVRFEFDSSAVLPGALKEMRLLDALVKKHPAAPLSLFGHADPVGNDDYNKTLSGRRVRAIYALLIRDVAVWEDLFSHPAGNDNWGTKSIQRMLQTVEDPTLPATGTAGPHTSNALKSFQGKNGLPATGSHNAATRAKLFKAYMDALCPFELTKADFLGKGADPDGKADFQGCSEFNPVLMFSAAENQKFQPQSRHVERNEENAPNRRVMALLFKPGTIVDPQRWPCPTVKEGVAKCKKRFWSDAGKRRQFQANRRTFEVDKDTYACRFYHRLFVLSPCASVAPPVSLALLEIVLDDDKDHVVDAAAPVAEFVRFGIWDKAYDASVNVKNAAAENANFVGDSFRRFYFRVRDPRATTPSVSVDWKTLKKDGSDDDAPASQVLTLSETAPGSKVFVSKAVILVTDDTDCDQPTNSGLSAPLPDVGVRNRGQSNHRLRRGHIDGSVQGEYRPAVGAAAVVKLPIFKRSPDERRRVPVRVINYGSGASAAYISGQFQHANDRWNQVGIQIDPAATVDRPLPAGSTDANGQYAGEANNAEETAALNDLIPITPDNTLTVVFVAKAGSNAYATVAERTNVALQDRFFVFINLGLNLNGDTLAHELHHVLFNRFDTATAQQFYTFNTNPSNSFGIPLPDVRVRRRIQNLNSADPDNDAANDNILNWARRVRTTRFPIGPGLGAATASTGNKLAKPF